MTKDLIIAEPEDSLEEALMELLDKKIGRLPVVDSNDPTKLVGILTKLDIIRTHAKLSSSR
jgi:chloride channel protein, CIC family